jgi:hypothetical protein
MWLIYHNSGPHEAGAPSPTSFQYSNTVPPPQFTTQNKYIPSFLFWFKIVRNCDVYKMVQL